MYRENQIRAALIKVLNQALNETGVSGYKVMSRSPQNITWDEDAVLLDKVSTQRHGFQSREQHIRKEGEKNVLYVDEVWIEELVWQITVVHKKQVNDTITTETGEDVLKCLQMWFNSAHGAHEMRGRTDVPMAPVHVFQARTNVYSDDSEINQRDESFDIKIIVVQSWSRKSPEIEGWEIEDYPI